MRILLVGAPGWNPERLRSLAEEGHELLGLWARSMPWDQGPYPSLDGVVRTVDPSQLAATLAAHPPEVVCGLFQVYEPWRWAGPVPGIEDDVWTLLRHVLATRAAGAFDAPVLFHWGFDVHVFDLDVVRVLDGQVFCNEEVLDWWTEACAQGGRGLDVVGATPVLGFLDSDRPMRRFMGDDLSGPISEREVHTACIGRPMGIDYLEVARAGIHLHLYGNGFDDIEQMLRQHLHTDALRADLRLVRDFVHLHGTRQLIGASWPVVEREKSAWVREFSRYDAGWSYIGRPFGWSALEDRAAIPNRLGTYLLAGLPVIASRLPGTYRYDELARLGVAIDLVDGDYVGLRQRLDAERATRAGRQAALAVRADYAFEATIDPLLALFDHARATYLAAPEPARRRAPAEPARPLVLIGGGIAPTSRRGGGRVAAIARRVTGGPVRRLRAHVLARRLNVMSHREVR